MAVPRLASDATALIESARGTARKRGHAELRPEHVLLAALRLAPALLVVARRHVDVRQLHALLDARMGAIASVSAYRDSSIDVPFSNALSETLARAARQRKVLFFQPAIDVEDITVALIGMAPCAAMIEEAQLDIAPIERFRSAAESHARRRLHRNVLVDHALLALFDEDPRFVEGLRVLGHDPANVQRKLDARLTWRLRSHRLAELPSLVQLVSARAQDNGIGIAAIVVDLLRHASVRTALHAADVNRYDLLYAYVHGHAPSMTTFDRSDAEVEVIFHDDGYSTQQFVMEVLQEAFKLGEASAKKKMFEVHEKGLAIVHTLPRDLAMAAVISARGAARDQLMPLRIEMVEKKTTR